MADFRVFYRIDSLEQMRALSTDEFFALANRCIAYEGAVRFTFDLLAAQEQEELEQAEQQDRLAETGAELAAVPVQDSYLHELLMEESAHG